MRAMVLEEVGKPLVERDLPIPIPKSHELLVKVAACGVCRTDLHIVDGELSHPKLPLVLGHQVVGTVVKTGGEVSKHRVGGRIGIPWLGGSCHHCEFCLSERENLCDQGIFTGYMRDGGYAEYCVVHEDYALTLPAVTKYDDLHVAPLLCAGVIGYRALKIARRAKKIGFYGFGSSAHILTQLVSQLGSEVYAFTRSGDVEGQKFARSLGAKWAGGSDELPPEKLDAALIFAPVGELYPQALRVVKKGGCVVSVGIHMSDIPAFPYSLLWEERVMTSVANLTPQDGIEFMELVEKYPVDVAVTVFSLSEANEALERMRRGKLRGSAVLKIAE